MKKTYITPSVELAEVITEQLMALSLKTNQPADPKKEIMAPEKGSWDIWED